MRQSSALKALIGKELWRNAGWGLLGLIAAASALVYAVKMGPANETRILESLFSMTALIAAFVSLVIGLVQVLPERRGDRWAFLTHRPVPRSTLFLGKAAAGITLYLAALTIPWTVSFVWIATSRHMPIFFDWRMLLPGVADLFCGIAYYFAGVLIGMRDARWYGSRVLGIGAPVFFSFVALRMPQFWQAIVAGAIGILITSAAAWGAFKTGGQFEGQPRATRIATGITVGAGAAIVFLIVSFSVEVSFFFSRLEDMPHTAYTLTADGKIVVTRQVNRVFTDVRDLEGRPLEFQETATRMQLVGFPGAMAPLQQNHWASSYRESGRFFKGLPAPVVGASVSWFYVVAKGLIAQYDNEAKEIIGWLGPDGLSPGNVPPIHRFHGEPLFRSSGQYGRFGSSFLSFPDAVYQLNLAQGTVTKVFTAGSDESVTGASSWADVTEIVTTQRVIVAGLDGTVQLTVPHDPPVKGYATVRVLRAGESTFLWYYPTFAGADRVNAPPELVTRYGRDGATEAHYSLPSQVLLNEATWAEVALPWVATPVTVPLVSALQARPFNWRSPNGLLGTSSSSGTADVFVITGLSAFSAAQLTVIWTLSALASLIPALLAYRRGRFYAFTARRLRLWTVLGFVLGPQGFILMLFLIDRPARESCPACGRKRVVTREYCEHCGELFLPPVATGVEIFEPEANPLTPMI